jgi:hypothetical protein
VRVAESQTFFHQIVSQIGGRGITLFGRQIHVVFFGFDGWNHVAVGLQTIAQGVYQIKQRFFVFLIVFVVRQWL